MLDHAALLRELKNQYAIHWFDDWKELPKHKCGVYLLMKDNKVIYIGQSKQLRKRLQPYSYKHRAYDGSQQIAVIFVSKYPKYLRFRLERILTHKFGL
jgi:hypothetical protein